MSELAKNIPDASAQLAGTTLSALESVVKTKQHRKEPLDSTDLAEIKKELVENDTNGLIEFLETERTLNDVCGLDSVKAWLRWWKVPVTQVLANPKLLISLFQSISALAEIV